MPDNIVYTFRFISVYAEHFRGICTLDTNNEDHYRLNISSASDTASLILTYLYLS